ncbi:MAG: hypothetical protein LBQ63_07900 [Deltaproteobacteria bacterium]|jgi:hypothetical protein|nr:hypothetical protein [Deltaproteobacteria bacterium]
MGNPVRKNAATEDLLAAELAVLARSYAKQAIEALADELENGKGASRISAANAILERGFGKSRQNLELAGNLGLEPKLPEELLNLLDGIYVHMR